MSEVVIRSAVIEDIGQLSDMYCEMYDILFTYGMPYKLDKKIIGEVLILQLKARACKYFVAEKDEQLVGFVAVEDW